MICDEWKLKILRTWALSINTDIEYLCFVLKWFVDICLWMLVAYAGRLIIFILLLNFELNYSVFMKWFRLTDDEMRVWRLRLNLLNSVRYKILQIIERWATYLWSGFSNIILCSLCPFVLLWFLFGIKLRLNNTIWTHFIYIILLQWIYIFFISFFPFFSFFFHIVCVFAFDCISIEINKFKWNIRMRIGGKKVFTFHNFLWKCLIFDVSNR